MISLLALLVVVIPSVWGLTSVTCGSNSGWYLGDGFYYKKITGVSGGWTGARTSCQALVPGKSDLAIIKSTASISVIRQMIGTNQNPWIGLRQDAPGAGYVESEYGFYWTDGSMFDFLENEIEWTNGGPNSGSGAWCVMLSYNTPNDTYRFTDGGYGITCTSGFTDAICSIPCKSFKPKGLC
jgi:hypothetical protein